MFKLGEIMDSQKAKNLNPIVLAFVGDAVYSLFIREMLTFSSDSKSGALNKMATQRVCATSQAVFMREVEQLLTEEEMTVYKRARNAKKSTRAKNASIQDYNTATGFEAVLGYLYLIGQNDRLNFLLNKGKANES